MQGEEVIRKRSIVVILGLLAAAGAAFGQIEGRKVFVAAGNPAGLGGDKAGMIGISRDGMTWELVALEDIDESLEKTPLAGIAYGQGRLVAVGGSRIIVSEDLKNWRLADSVPEKMTGGINAVAYGDGMFVAVGGTSVVCWSKDGLAWTRLTDAKGNLVTLNSELDFGKTHLYGVVFHKGKFYALGNGNTITVLVPNAAGLDVESSTMKGNVTSRLNDMAAAEGRVVVVGTVEDYMSDDLVKWKKISPWQQYFGVCYGAGKFVGVTGFGSVWYSANAEGGTWKEASSGKLMRDAYFSVAYGNGVFVAGANGQLSVSKDGMAWKNASAAMRFKKIIYVP